MYAQCGEDDHYHKYIDLDKIDGKYIDIGAGYPIEISNTFMLYEKGWSGLCIEPCKLYHPGWPVNRPRDIYITDLILDKSGPIRMSETVAEGTFLFEEYKDKYGITEHNAITLAELLEKYPRFYEVICIPEPTMPL